MKIYIDAGHNNNGWDIGAVGYGLKEQDVTFNIARFTGEFLEAQGFEVKYSRPTLLTNIGIDTNSSISARYAMANEWGADYFISLHCNTGGSGAEVYYYRQDSLSFAETILNTYTSETNFKNNGVHFKKDIDVIRYTDMPAILLQLACIDHMEDAEILYRYQKELAEIIAKGFHDFLLAEKVERKDNDALRYHRAEDVPFWALSTIQKLLQKGYLYPDDAGLFDLSEDMMKILVINDRAGLYNLFV